MSYSKSIIKARAFSKSRAIFNNSTNLGHEARRSSMVVKINDRTHIVVCAAEPVTNHNVDPFVLPSTAQPG